MKLVIQRVKEASVTVDEKIVGKVIGISDKQLKERMH